jgi:ATP-binding cassette subfamily B protein
VSDYDEFEEEEFNSQFDSRTFARILGLLKPHWKWVATFLFMIGVVSVIDSYYTYLSKRIIDESIIVHNLAVLKHYAIIYGSLILFQAAGVFCFIYLVSILGERIRYDLRQMMFNHLQQLSLSYYSRTPVGWIMSRVTSDSDRVADLMTWGLLDSTWAVINIITSAVFMFIINWKLALVVLALLPVLMFVAVKFKTLILREYRKVRKQNSKITASYNENITGVRVVKALGREDDNLQEFSEKTDHMYRAAYRAAWLSALFLPTVQIISAVALAALVWVGGIQVEYGLMTIGGIQAFISYITFIMWPVQDIARVYADMQNAVASAERIFSLVDAVPDIQDRPEASDPGTILKPLEFNHVDFYYEADKPVLTDFSLKVMPGETIALVGPTGGGKSTIINLLCRFYEPRNGTITIGGEDYTQLSTYAIQSRIGIVLQTPHLFSGTIRENIRYGRLDAGDEEIENAAKIAGAHEFIQTLEKKYDQPVGEGGNLLSVGQKQLISLARAVLAKPEIFIMDEATSSIDTLTEALIQHGMEALMKGRTSFIVAHRLSTIKRADRIIFIDGGKIQEIGSHAELMRLKGHYYKLYTQQFRQEREQEYNPFEATLPEAQS